MTNKKTVDSNVVGLSYAEEASFGVLPDLQGGTVGDQAGAIWYPLDPNEYSDFGAEITTVARNPINQSRQRRKGVVTDLDASGGFQQDLTQSNLTRLMQGFFFADAHERMSNKPINGKAANTAAVVSITGTGSVIEVGSGKGASFAVGMLLKTSGFANSANNIDLMMITAISGDDLTVDATGMVDETYSVGILEVVGFEFTDLQTTYSANTLTLTSATGFAGKGFQVGEWIFVGGDATSDRFALGASGENAPGYARIHKVEANALTLKEPTWTPLTNDGSGKTIRVFTGKFLRNEKTPALIKQRSYQIERTLGEDENGTQSEVLLGSIPNEFSMNVESADKMVCDLSFVATSNELRSGADGLKDGDRTNTISVEDAYNTSSDVYQQRLFVYGDTPSPTSLFAYVMSATISINNNAIGRKAIGTIGSFSISVGDFEVTGNLEVYFTTIAAVNAVRQNKDVGYNLILAARNVGIVYDIPLVSLGGGRVTVEKDEPIMLPLEQQAAENEYGYTMSATYFSYLPLVAMASE